MSRRKVSIDFADVVSGVTRHEESDELTQRILDASSELLVAFGLRRWTMDDVADRTGIGRTSVYRKFTNRDELVHAVLARELRGTLQLVANAAGRFESLEDKVIEGAMAALDSAEGSVAQSLLLSDPATFLPFFTTEAGPLVVIARQMLATALIVEFGAEPVLAAELAELAARLGLSFLLTPQTVFPRDDPLAAHKSLTRVFRLVLAPLAPSAA